jgi:hypothetical protein
MENLDFTNMQEKKENTYIKLRGLYQLEIENYSSSSDIEGYNKTPFVKFFAKNVANQEITQLMFWLPKKETKENVREIQLKMIKEFFENLGCNTKELKGKALLDDTVGKSCKVVLKEVEKVITGKSNGKPMVVTNVEYYYSAPLSKSVEVNESKLVRQLTEEQRLAFNDKLNEWNKANQQQAVTQAQPEQPNLTEEDMSDLPF